MANKNSILDYCVEQVFLFRTRFHAAADIYAS